MVFSPFLIALSLVVLPVSSSATPYYPLTSFKRQEIGWPQGVATEVLNSSSPNFAADTARWTTFDAPTFDSVFLPKSEADLTTGLKYLTSNNISFLTKSGGHGYSTTLGQVQNGVMINMENFNYTIMNNDSSATVGSGVIFNDMIQVISDAGRELTVGSCPCVGAVGAMLGGGAGRLEGVRGLTSDAVTKIRMALWNGTIVEASESVNSDLFWGMRGAGQNFGVVIEATFETFPQTNGGVNYQADITFGIESVGTLIDIYNSLFPLPPALALILIGEVDPTTLQPIPVLNLIYAGTTEEGREFTQKFANISTSVAETNLTWAQLPDLSADAIGPANCVNNLGQIMYGTSIKTLDKASFIELYSELGSFVQANPNANKTAFIVETFGQQAVQAKPDDFDAFPHRGEIANLYELDIQYGLDDSIAPAGDAFGKKWRDHFKQPNISGYSNWTVYQNYGHGDEPPSVLYGQEEWRHKRLTDLKNAYDPFGFFNAYHAIPTSLASWT